MLINTRDIQGIVTPGHPFDDRLFVFLGIVDVEKARTWLANLSDTLTSCFDLLCSADMYSRAGSKRAHRSHAINILLSAKGCEKLGVIEPFEQDRLFDLDRVERFSDAFGASQDDEFKSKHRVIDLVLIVSFSGLSVSDIVGSFLRTDLGCEVVAVEVGSRIYNQAHRSKEHFGFEDPISQPVIDGVAEECPYLKTYSRSVSELKKVTVCDPGTILFLDDAEKKWRGGSFLSNGTFSFFWKIRQHPENFTRFVQYAYDVIRPLNLEGVDNVEDVRRVILGSHEKYGLSGSHLWKLISEGRATQPIIRRGVTYGESSDDVGILFLSFQKSIVEFASIVKDWMMNQDFPSEAAGTDVFLRGAVDGNASNEVFLFDRLHPRERILTLRTDRELVTSIGFFPLFCPSVSALSIWS